MKKISILSLMGSLLLLASCKLNDMNINLKNIIEPSSMIVKREIPQPAFDEIKIDAIANVKYIQSQDSTYRVVFSAPDNYVDLFGFKVSNKRLDISLKKDDISLDSENIDITIYSPTISEIENAGVASVEIDRLTADELEVDNSGCGEIYLSGLQIGRIDVDCSGVGSIELSGIVNEAKLKCSGVGGIKAQNLKAKSVKGDVSGVGGIDCYASESIEARVTGVGSFRYAGRPQQRETFRSGVGDITEL